MTSLTEQRTGAGSVDASDGVPTGALHRMCYSARSATCFQPTTLVSPGGRSARGGCAAADEIPDFRLARPQRTPGGPPVSCPCPMGATTCRGQVGMAGRQPRLPQSRGYGVETGYGQVAGHALSNSSPGSWGCPREGVGDAGPSNPGDGHRPRGLDGISPLSHGSLTYSVP